MIINRKQKNRKIDPCHPCQRVSETISRPNSEPVKNPTNDCNTISNEELPVTGHQDSIETIIEGRRWTSIGRVLRRERSSITRTALPWTPAAEGQGEKKLTHDHLAPDNWRRLGDSETHQGYHCCSCSRLRATPQQHAIVSQDLLRQN